MVRIKFSIVIISLAVSMTVVLFGLVLLAERQSEQLVLGCSTVPIDYITSGDQHLDLPGRLIFDQNCSVCHRLGQKLVGPGLRNIFEIKDSVWNIKMIRNAKKLRDSGDSLAIRNFKDYNETQHTNFESMADSTLKQLVTYLIMEGKRD
ncbi:MAG: cytochrome c [Bacteroidota bacterium]